MSDTLLYGSLFVTIPMLTACVYLLAHDPRSIKMLEHWHLRQAKRLNAWGKAQASRKKVYEKAMGKTVAVAVRRPQMTEVVEG
jgi:hypothetical protein